MMYRALGYEFELGDVAAEVASDLQRVLEPLAISDAQERGEERVPRERIDLVALSSGHLEFRVDGVPLLGSKSPGVATHLVVAHLTARAVASRADDLVLHAGCVVLDDRVVIISGRSGTGKSTLTSALIADGAKYVTDEAVVIGADGIVREGLGRSPQISRESRALLGFDGWASVEHPDSSSYVEIPSSDRFSGELPRSGVIVVLLGGAPTTSRAALVARLIGDSFEPSRRTQDGLRRAAALADGAVWADLARAPLGTMVAAIRH